ncbi:hypothetical protein VF04_04385 [Nostoc linckia z7]|uniref:Uncharacterized protein n=2 Tax=Nostoc linckia TaxID=92942 RepID=A0A9Q6ENH7_NOSLI|nr:hypothetical protein [Nostoc linckia]PHK42950.1 hypothetical protein VF12_01085 [Nostoc linckia z15]PHK48107.1 hypothetical protein VF13_02060 [Nostoc linckia z16]PHJ65027.1 hypothetical protein VF02_11870 [Nostoc linckia z1]PHJ70068.1 hypothetical protein VF05_11265 [Nostoc linckia z3]PHJ75106.1 hypothetical protein VF03_12190 [Nostoc linckia z2]
MCDASGGLRQRGSKLGRLHSNHIDWVRSLVKQCQDASVPVFVKQLGENVVNSLPYIDGVAVTNTKLNYAIEKAAMCQNFLKICKLGSFQNYES